MYTYSIEDISSINQSFSLVQEFGFEMLLDGRKGCVMVKDSLKFIKPLKSFQADFSFV